MMTTLLRLVLRALPLVLPVVLFIAPAQAERRVALVIGNAQYQKVAKLANPPSDVRAVADALTTLGFDEVVTKLDLNREQLVSALRDFARSADKADWAVVYYSGHGIEISGTNYLIPVDAHLSFDRDVDFEAVDVNKVLTAVDRAGKLRIVILDACRDNPFASQMKKTSATRSIGRGLASVEPEAGTLVVYAAKHGQVALDGDRGNSPFVQSLVKWLRTPDVEVRRLFDLVRDDVIEQTKRQQQPFTYGSLSGRENFYFLKSAAAASAVPKMASAEPPRPGQDKAPNPALAPFDKVMRDWMAQYGVKQGSLAVLREDRLVLAQGYGGRGADTRVNLWGLSTAITALCVASLVDESKLRLDARFGRLMQSFYARHGRPVDERLDEVRVDDLLTQRSGLHRSAWAARFPDGFAPGAWQLLQGMSPGAATAEMLMPKILSVPLAWPPGERYGYANPNYLLLGQLIESVTGEAYAESCGRRVLAKAGIDRPQLDATWGRLLQAAGGWSLSGPEYVAFLRLFRPRQPDMLSPDMRRWLWDGERKWVDARREIAYSLGTFAYPKDRNIWQHGSWFWQQPNAKDGPISVKQGTYGVLAGDGTGWFASFDTVNIDEDQKAVLALDTALWNARKEVKSWPATDGFSERGIRPVSIQRTGAQRN